MHKASPPPLTAVGEIGSFSHGEFLSGRWPWIHSGRGGRTLLDRVESRSHKETGAPGVTKGWCLVPK